MPWQVRDLDGQLMNAHFEIEGDTIIFHSRGGSAGQGGQNSEYGPGLRAVLKLLDKADLSLSDAWVDSITVQGLPLEDRRILPNEPLSSPDGLFTALSRNMRRIGQDPNVTSGGNSTRRIRLAVSGADEASLAAALDGEQVERDMRLPAEQLDLVRPEHVYRAVQNFRASQEDYLRQASTDYDLVDEDGTLLPPKVVFQLAAGEALGREIRPKEFVGGEGTPCFRILRRAGYEIRPKGANSDDRERQTPPPPPEDQEWSEGNPKRVEHLRRERSRTAARAKREAFRLKHGRLRCERCHLDPIATYGGDEGEACIEVHHVVPLSHSEGKRNVNLDELQLLCANCHRVVHRRLRDDSRDSTSSRTPSEMEP